MKLSTLKHYVDSALDRFGDIECWLDVDSEDDEIYTLEGVFCDIDPDDETDISLVLATYEVEQVTKLTAVK